MPDVFLDTGAIRASTFVRHVEIHEALGSTNDRAAQLAGSSEIELPALIVARHQTSGRGRGENVWMSADGALTFSLLLDPSVLGIRVASWPQLSLATGVAVCNALSAELDNVIMRAGASPPPIGADDAPARFNSLVAIKWPNDVMLDGRKVCGILIESPGGSVPAKDRLIVGIGINVNNSCRTQPALRVATPSDQHLANAVSLRDFTGQKHDLQHILCETLRAFEARANQLANGDTQLPAAWQQLCWLTDRRIEVQTNGNHTAGICAGIDSTGGLLLENGSGKYRIISGSVSVL